MEEALVAVTEAVLEGASPRFTFDPDSFQDEFKLHILYQKDY